MSDSTTANWENLTSSLLLQTPVDFSLERGCARPNLPKSSKIASAPLDVFSVAAAGLDGHSTITSLLLCLASSLKEKAVIIVLGVLD